MLNIQVSSNRIARLTGFHCWPTYLGLMEGWPNADLNRAVIDGIVEKYNYRPVFVVPPEIVGATELPPVACVAELESAPLTPQSKMDGSFLTLVWFRHDVLPSIFNMVSEAMDRVVWEDRAKEFEW